MNLKKCNTVAGYIVYAFLLLFSVSVNALEMNGEESGINFNSWESPFFLIENTTLPDDTAWDIEVENVVYDNDGSMRFQLSHSGPLSRQVFANVRRIEQEDGFTRSIITNIADGLQTEYLSRTVELPLVRQGDKISDGGSLNQLKSKDGQTSECLYCLADSIYRAACARAEVRAFQTCHSMCERMGGVKHFEPGTCGIAHTECICWIQPPREAEDF